MAASSCGPWISLALFHHLGNRWVAEDCRLVLLSGVTLMAVPLALMCAFDDDKTVAHGQEQQGQGREPMLPTTRSNGNSGTLTGPALEPPADQICQADGSATAAVGAEAQPAADLISLSGPAGGCGNPDLEEPGCCGCRCCALPDGAVVTVLVSVSDFIGAFASGGRPDLRFAW